MSTTAAGSVQALDPNAFLQLFITQVKYQDPTAPMDPSQMMSNLAQLTTVQSLNNLQTSFQQTLAEGMIGAQVTYSLNGQTQTGQVQAAKIQSGQVGLLVGDQFVSLDSISQVAPMPPAASSAAGQGVTGS